MATDPGLLLGDAARAIGVSPDTLRRWERAGKLRTTRDGANRRRVPSPEIERLARRPTRHRAGDTLSARNRFPGVVRSVEIDGVMALVEIEAGPHRITDDLTADDVTIAIGAEDVPIGSYTRETLAKLPADQEEAILDNVRSNEPDVKGIVGKLTQGAADAGFVYVTDVNATDGKLEAIKLPTELQPEVTYGAGVVHGAGQPEQAERFVDRLVDGPCADALHEAGFGPAP